MSDDEQTPEQPPKIIVDDDWKEQVAKEKEMAGSSQAETKPAETKPADSPASVEPQTEPARAASMAVPPASFEVLVSMLFTQALGFLGEMPDPASGETEINKPFAKHTIDTLEMLSEKTAGNLSDDERRILSEALHALRMAFVATKG